MSKPDPLSAGAGQAGVTLIELVAALVIIALMFTIAGSGLRFLIRSGDRGAQLIARHDMLSRGTDALRRDIERLERVVWKRGRDNTFVFHGDSKGLTFAQLSIGRFVLDPGIAYAGTKLGEQRGDSVLAPLRHDDQNTMRT